MRIPVRPSRRARGMALLELLTVVAALVIVLGLMISLARYVRDRSAENLTRDVLARLEYLLDDYMARNNTAPKVEPLLEESAAEDKADRARPQRDEAGLRLRAGRNNAQFVQALRGDLDRYLPVPRGQALAGGWEHWASTQPAPLQEQLPSAVYNEVFLRDAWGHLVVFMPRGHPWIGLAREDRPFFVSPGPDGQYLTRQDNLYSYETDAARPGS